MTQHTNSSVLDAALLRTAFDVVYIINLPERTDRRREVAAQLSRIGLTMDDPLVKVFPALRPSDPGAFDSIGARGCFLSHLGVLTDAVAAGYRSILILEDDVDWTRAALAPTARMDGLHDQDWGFVHGGLGQDRSRSDVGATLLPLSPEQEMRLTHFIAFRGEAIFLAMCYLEAILGRPAGSPEGGPMHVDGAYSWFRKDHPEIRALVFDPAIAMQRSSRSDISEPTGWRRTKAADWARKLLRPIRSRLRDKS